MPSWDTPSTRRDETDACQCCRLPTMVGKFDFSIIVGLCPLPCRRTLATHDDTLTGSTSDNERETLTPTTSPTRPSTLKVSSASFDSLTGTESDNHRATSTPSIPPSGWALIRESNIGLLRLLPSTPRPRTMSGQPRRLRLLSSGCSRAIVGHIIDETRRDETRQDGGVPMLQTPDDGWQV